MRVEYILPDGEIKDVFELADGLTLQQAACTLFPDTEGKFPAPVIALVGDQPAVRELGDWDYPLSGNVCIQFRQLAMGGGGGGDGGSNPLQMVMQIAVVVLAAVATFYIGGAGGWAVAAGFTAGQAAFMGALAGATIMALGTLAISAIFPTNTPSISSSGQMSAREAEAASPTYNINASGNQARLYQPEPEGFGRMKIVPDFVAQTWSQYVNNDQIGYFVYALGRGHYEVESMQFGDTVFWKDGSFVMDSGYVDTGGEAYNNTVNYNLPAKDNWTEDSNGWCATVDAVDKGTQAATVTVQIHFPNGLASYKWVAASERLVETPIYGYKYYGDYVEWDILRYEYTWETVPAHFEAISHSVTVRIQVRKVDDDGNILEGWVTKAVKKWTKTNESAFTETVTLNLGFGRWQIRARNDNETTKGAITGSDGSTKNVRERVRLASVSSVGASMSVEFVQPGHAVTIFPDNITTSSEVNGQEMFAPNQDEFAGAIGPYVTNPPGTQTNRIYLDFTLPQGLGAYDTQGNFGSYWVSWIIEYQPITDTGAEAGPWELLDTPSMERATRTPQRLTQVYTVSPGRYRVRVRRTSNSDSGNGRTLDTLYWGGLRAALPGSYVYPISCIALSVKANNTLSQAASRDFSVIATRKLPLYNRKTKTWSEEVATRSWAAAISHVCKSEWGGRLSDENIDLDTLWAIDEKLQAQGWNYDAYIDGPYLVWTLLGEMCSSQLVVPRLIGPVLSFVEDAPNRTPTFALTPRNIMRNSFQIRACLKNL